MLRMKELWLGQVVRTGARDFGFVQLQGLQGMAALRFETRDFIDPSRGRTTNGHPCAGEPVMVLLSNDARCAFKVWRLRPTARPGNTNGSSSLRHRGIITAVKTPDYGFLADGKNGQAYFVHRMDIIGGGPLLAGQRVTFLLTNTPKGKKACEVRIS
jgi:cold shock CspA family protein